MRYQSKSKMSAPPPTQPKAKYNVNRWERDKAPLSILKKGESTGRATPSILLRRALFLEPSDAELNYLSEGLNMAKGVLKNPLQHVDSRKRTFKSDLPY